jgi:signal transduction histidine kinase
MQPTIEIGPRSGRQPFDSARFYECLWTRSDRFLIRYRPLRGLAAIFPRTILGLTPQALCRRPLPRTFFRDVMTAGSQTKIGAFGLNSLGFVLVVLAAYLSALVTMGYVLNTIAASKAAILIVLSVVYLTNGVFGYAWARNRTSLRPSLIYLAVQAIVAVTLLYYAKSPAILIAMLPLAGQSVVLLPQRLTYAACAVIWLLVVSPMAIMGQLGPAAVLGMFFLAGIVFVVVITQLAVREQRARAEVERLLAELKDANEKLRDYAGHVGELATLNERNRLARDIHDTLGHYLTVVIVQIEAAIAMKQSDHERSLDSLRKAQGLAQKGLDEVRRSVTALRSPGETRTLLESLQTLFEESHTSGVKVDFRSGGTPRKLAPAAELAVYRAVQEGLTNVRKHSQAKSATITLDYAERFVRLVIRDNGVGTSQAEPGFGLTGLRERVELLGGEVKIRTGPDQGFTLEVGLRDDQDPDCR